MNKVSAGQFCSLGVKIIGEKSECIASEIKMLTKSECPKTDRFFCKINFLSKLKKSYNNASVQLIYLNTRHTATLFTCDNGSDLKSGNVDHSEDEDREMITMTSLVDCEIIVDGGMTWLADGARFYICDFSQILGVGRMMPSL